jgi:hypothetical protein
LDALSITWTASRQSSAAEGSHICIQGSYERARTWYVEDLIRIWELEILPYKEILGDILWQRLLSDYMRQYEWPLTFSDPPPMKFF